MCIDMCYAIYQLYLFTTKYVNIDYTICYSIGILYLQDYLSKHQRLEI
jgi:hypothetical protein